MSGVDKQKEALDWWNYCISDEKQKTLISKYNLKAKGKHKASEILNIWLKEATQSKR
jgi:hypothetical protein